MRFNKKSMVKKLYRYRIWCSTEGIYVEKWSETQITTCPNNNAHSVDTNLRDLLETFNGK